MDVGRRVDRSSLTRIWGLLILQDVAMTMIFAMGLVVEIRAFAIRTSAIVCGQSVNKRLSMFIMKRYYAKQWQMHMRRLLATGGTVHLRRDRIQGVYGDPVVKRNRLRCLCRIVLLSSRQ